MTAITIIVAIVGSIIAFLQLRTAHLKVVLELFERRMKAYTAIREVLQKIKASGRATNEDCFEFREAVNDAEFLFGEEIIKKLHEIQEAIFELQMQGAEKGESERAKKDDVERYYKEFPNIFRCYMLMDQKLNLLSMLRTGLFPPVKSLSQKIVALALVA